MALSILIVVIAQFMALLYGGSLRVHLHAHYPSFDHVHQIRCHHVYKPSDKIGNVIGTQPVIH